MASSKRIIATHYWAITCLSLFTHGSAVVTDSKGYLAEEPRNLTVLVGEAAVMHCRVSQDIPTTSFKPHIIWHARRTGRIHPEPDSVMSTSGDGLHWRAVNKSDEDWYRCSVRIGQASAHSQWAYLRVLAHTRISEYPGGYSVNHGTRLTLQCVAHGDPLPSIVWLLNNTAITEGVEETSFHGYVRSVLSIIATSTANYTCEASNTVRGQPHVDTRTSTLSVLPKLTSVTRPAGYCARYEGTVCREQVGGSGLVWYNSTTPHSERWHNEQITRQLWAEMIENFQQPCRAAAEQLLCRFAFPECKMLDGYQTGLPLCREDCIATQLLFCVNEWLLIQETNKDQTAIKGREHFHLPVCEDLPEYGDGTRHSCSHVGLTTMRHDLVTHSCRRGNGRWYIGTINVTTSGIPCQRWDSQTPHSHNRPPDVFPEIKGAENYCRNAGGEEPRPWCYTTDPMVRWQHCHVPLCADELRKPPGARHQDRGEEGLLRLLLGEERMLLVWVLGSSAVLLLALVLLVCTLLLIRVARRKTPAIIQPVTDTQAVVGLGLVPENDAYHETGALLHPTLHHLQYDRNNIVFIRDLGQGAFGRVFQGRATKLLPGEEETVVAVKVLKEDAGADMAGDFEREACTLASFHHENIVRLLGVCAIGRPMCLLFEYMGKGDLNTFLRSCSPSGYVVPGVSGRGFTDTSLSPQDMLHIGQQVAAGMVFLSNKKFVHRDLATRNCLIADDMTVKIADFGLSQRLYMADYYRGGERDAIPIRWMPLESILYSRYTVESDVWAFGVVLWEIFSFALQPYYGLSHEEVVALLQEGGQLAQPALCPADVYCLMTWCWQRRPQDRPSFCAVHQVLEDIKLGRVPILPALPKPLPYTPASPQHGTAITCEGRLGAQPPISHTELPHLLGSDSCFASMRAGSRGSFCSTDLALQPPRPCSCVPQQRCVATLPRNTGSSLHASPRRHRAAPLSHTPDLLPPPQTLPRAQQGGVVPRSDACLKRVPEEGASEAGKQGAEEVEERSSL